MKARTERSKRYESKNFFYWWDVSPNHPQKRKGEEGIRFLKRDSNDFCEVSFQELKPYLIKARRSSRSQRTWGVKVLKDRPNELAFKPPSGSEDWKYLKVEWRQNT